MTSAAEFTTRSNEAYRRFEVKPPGQGWFAFDVSMQAARAGRATRFAMTVWDFHTRDDGSLVKAIFQDPDTGDYWYRVRRTPAGTVNRPRTALTNAIEIADRDGLPMHALLKGSHNGRCSLKHVSRIEAVVEDDREDALWLLLRPSINGIGCDVAVKKLPHAQLRPSREGAWRMHLEARIEKSLNDSQRNRLKRLQSAGRLPKKVLVMASVFDRNPDVVAETLFRADGVCGVCKKEAPFNRRDGTKYLEVHHRVPLAYGGEDTVENAVAVCPNCHRDSHYGANPVLGLPRRKKPPRA